MGLGGLTLPTPPLDVGGIQKGLTDAAKAEAQKQATGLMSSDAVKSGLSQTEGLAKSVGLGDQFAAAKDAALNKIESLTGLSLSGASGVCPSDRIDIPTISNVLIATVENPYTPSSLKDFYLSYVTVDSVNPPPTETANKNKLWYISIANTVFLVGLGILYGQTRS